MEDQEIQGVKFRSFVSLCFKEASRGSVERTDWLVLVGGGVLGLLAFLIPAWERTVTKALLLLPLSAFASVGVFRLLLSPYLVYRTRDLQVRIQNKELTGQITERNREIASLTHKEERTPAEQYNYETAKKCLARFGGKAAIALRHLKTCGSITVTGPGMGNSTMSTFLPPNITLAELNWALGACAGEGVVVYREPLGGAQRIYEIAKNMDKALAELLY